MTATENRKQQKPERKPSIGFRPLTILSASLAVVLSFLYLLWMSTPIGQIFHTPAPTWTATSTSRPPPHTKQPRTSTPAGVGYMPVLEYTEYHEPSINDVLGELSVDYPSRMAPGTSNSVIVSIEIPEYLEDIRPWEIERIITPQETEADAGILSSHKSTILVAGSMVVEISSPVFTFENLYPLQQDVTISDFDKPTLWAWTIEAPDSIGVQVFTLQTFLEDNIKPSYTGIIQIEVLAPTTTPAPTGTPLPPTPSFTPTKPPTLTPSPTITLTPTPTLTAKERIVEGIVDDFPVFLGALAVIIAAFIAGFVQLVIFIGKNLIVLIKYLIKKKQEAERGDEDDNAPPRAQDTRD